MVAPPAGPGTPPPVPPRKPNPVAQDPLVGVDRVRLVAVMAPVVPAGPMARAHWPTTIAAALAVVVVVNVVVPVSVTATVDVFCVRGLVSWTVTVEPVTPVTRPVAAPKEPPPNPPGGRLPAPGVPAGRPPNPPGGRLPVPGVPARRPPNPPRLHVPLVGWLIDTVVAVIGSPNGVLLDEADVGLPNAEMQEPTVMAVTDVAVIWWIAVDGV